MKRLPILLIVLAFLSVPNLGKAQAMLNLMNGKQFIISDYNDTSFTDITYKYDRNYFENLKIKAWNNRLEDKLQDKMSGDSSFSQVDFKRVFERRRKALKAPKLKTGSSDKDEVFSLTLPSGTEKLFYHQDADFGNPYSEASMRSFIAGERDARLHHRSAGAFWGGVGVGLGAGYAMENSIWTFAVPFVWTLSVRIPTIKVKHSKMSSMKYLGNEDYLAGYESAARSRDMVQGLKGSAIGVICGMLLYGIVNPNNVNYW